MIVSPRFRHVLRRTNRSEGGLATRGFLSTFFVPNTYFQFSTSSLERLNHARPQKPVSGDMVDRSSDDRLPAGWTVEVKVRNNGKKDKCYLAPSGGLKFYSRLDVFRYLKTQHISCPNFKQQKKDTCNKSGKNVVVQKVLPEGLPPGWIKEIKVTKKAGKIRRDPYYTHPACGFIFRSMKAVLHYVKTGELGKRSFKPKDIHSSSVELEEYKTSSPAVAKKHQLAVSGVRKQISRGQSSKTDVIEKDEQILESARTGDSIPQIEQTSDHREVGIELNISNLEEAKTSKHIKGHGDSAVSGLVPPPATGVLPEKQPLENQMTRHETNMTWRGLHKSKGRKVSNLPRRASKRLAGLEIDPIPELKTSKRACQAAVKQSGETETCTVEASTPDSSAHAATQPHFQFEARQEAKCGFGTSKSPEVQPASNSSEQLFSDLATPEGHAGKVEAENKGDEKKQHNIILPLGNLVITEDDKADEKPAFPLDLPLGEILSDPCIEFAIKTLTGLAFDNSKITEVSMGSSNCEHPSGDLSTLATLEKHSGEVDKDRSDKEQRCPVMAPGDVAFPAELARKVGSSGKANEKPGSPFALPIEDSWIDPDTEFAMKTLTDPIPVGNDFNIQDKGEKTQGYSVVLPLEDPTIQEERSKKAGTDDEVNEKPVPPLNAPFGDFWTDPCIEFAVKTLTGAIPVESEMDTQDYFHPQFSSFHTKGSK